MSHRIQIVDSTDASSEIERNVVPPARDWLKGCVAAACGLVLWSSPAAASYYTFDTNGQGWESALIGRPLPSSTYDTLFANLAAPWSASSGVLPGSLYMDVGTDVTRRGYWIGIRDIPNALGALAVALATSISSTGNWSTIAGGNVMARWIIGKEYAGGTSDMFISRGASSINLNTLGTGWNRREILLAESNFFRWPNSAANNLNFSQLLSDYNTVGLLLFSDTDTLSDVNGGPGTWTADSRLRHYGAYATSGTASFGVDDFGAVPEPGTGMLLAAGLAALVLRGRGRRVRTA
jgi:hypothetical protein